MNESSFNLLNLIPWKEEPKEAQSFLVFACKWFILFLFQNPVAEDCLTEY
jgi:hypothetical protein